MESKDDTIQTIVPNCLCWDSVNVSISDNIILSRCWGSIPAGEVCAAIGSSGAGKTTLLNVLAGRIVTNGRTEVSGKVFVGGHEIRPINFRKNIAYVMQEDALVPTATPRESLRFSAVLRLSTEPSVVNELVEEILERLHLNDCANTVIGGHMAMKGISGGERKRTSIGVEIITNPSILLLDEPTSGLDSFNAFNVVTVLKRIAAAGSAVFCTMHQPSSDIFAILDWLLILHGGKMVYFGRADGLVPYLSSCNVPCPSYFNPAEFVIKNITECTPSELKAIMIQEPSEFTPSASVDRHRQLSSELLKFKRASSFATQMKELYWREMVRVSRDITGLITRFGTAAFMNLLFALIFLGTGDGDNADVEDFNTHVGAIVLINISSMFGSAMPVMIQFPSERPVFLREYSSGTYSAVAYFLSRFFIEVPILFTQILMGYTIVYFSIQFQGEFIFLVLAGFGVAIVSNSLAVLLGCAVQDVQRVTELSPLIFVPQIHFSGYFIRTEQIPNFLRWAQYLCGLKYGVAIAFIVEFDLNLSSCSEDLARENCKGIKESNDVDEWWFNVVMLIVLLFAFRTAAMMLLVLRAN